MDNNIDKLINGAFQSERNKTSLRQKFESRLETLGITFNQFIDSYEMNFRITNSILDGQSKNLDLVSVLKLAKFLNVEIEALMNECISYMPLETQVQLQDAQMRTFILDQFNLNAFKKDGIIKSTKDFHEIEQSLLIFFGLKNIYEYADLDQTAGLFSTTKVFLKDQRPKKSFKNKSIKICENIVNPNLYHEENLKDFFPKIRAYSLDIDNGLIKLIKDLYKLGITVVLHPSLSSTGARGLTIASDGKPAIILTDIGKKYSTLWFALIHELYHVIFDWDAILAGQLHISDEDGIMNDKEIAADNFAREYMFPAQRMATIIAKIPDIVSVKEFAKQSDVHYSIIYDNYCYDHKDQYPLYTKYIRTPWLRLQNSLLGGLTHSNSPEEFAQHYQRIISNN